MAEYIKREDAINLLWLYADESCASVVSDFENLPAADVAEARHGRWSPVAFGIGICTTKYQCSVCKQYKDVDRPYNYCPHCGALMREAAAQRETILTQNPAKDADLGTNNEH